MPLAEKLLELIGSFWHSLTLCVIVPEYMGGVLLRLGRYHHTLDPGVRWKLPLIDECILTDTAVTTMELRPQTLTTRDGKSVVISAIVKYRVRNVKPFLLEIWDANDVLKDVTMGAIKEATAKADFAEIFGDGPIESKVIESVRREVNQYGFQIYRITFADQGTVKSLRILTDVSHSPAPPGGN